MKKAKIWLKQGTKDLATRGFAAWSLVVFCASYMYGQTGALPGAAAICGVKNWILVIATAMAFGGVAWLAGGVMAWHRGHGDGLQPVVEKLPALVILGGLAAFGTYLGLVYC